MITVSIYEKGSIGLKRVKELGGASFDDSEREMAHGVMDKIDLDKYDVVIVYHTNVDNTLLAKARMSPFFNSIKPKFAPYEGTRAEYHGEA